MIRPGIGKAVAGGTVEPRVIDLSAGFPHTGSAIAGQEALGVGGIGSRNMISNAVTAGTQTGSTSGSVTTSVGDRALVMTCGLDGAGAQSRRVVIGYEPAPYYDADRAPVTPGLRGAFRCIMQIAWGTPRTAVATDCASGMELACASVDAHELVARNGRGIAIHQRASGLRFLSRAGIVGSAFSIDEEIADADAISGSKWLQLEFRIESARRNRDAILTVLLDDVVKLRESWGDGRLPAPGAAERWMWTWAISSHPDAAQSIYLGGVRYMVAEHMGQLL